MATGRLGLLVSVRNAEEAEEALAGGATWIDLKEPRRGALGAVDAARAREVVACVAGRAPISAAAGELSEWPRAASRELLTVAGVSHLKLGLAGCREKPWPLWWRRAQCEAASAGKQLVAAAYADHTRAEAPCPTDVARWAASAEAPWLLVDTFDKNTAGLLDCFSSVALEELLRTARRAGCRVVVAGRLDAASIARLPWELIDMVAVRGAACRGARDGRVDRARVAELVDELSTLGVTPGRNSSAVCQ